MRRSARHPLDDWLAKTALRLIEVTAPRADRDEMVGDLLEDLAQRQQEGSSLSTLRRRMLVEVALSLPRNLARRLLSRSTAPRENPQGRGDSMFTELRQDLRFAIRGYLERPVFALTILATLTVGIGVNTLIYSAADSLLFHPSVYPQPERLLGLGTVYPKLRQGLGFWEVLSPAEVAEIREQVRTLESVVAWDMGNRALAGEDAPENVATAFWWGNAFETLGVSPELGRGFSERDLEAMAPVAVISHRLWQRRFGAQHDIVGHKVLVGGSPYEIVGVMPPRVLIYGTDLWIPMPVGPEVFPRQARNFQILARLAEGHSRDQVAAELETIARRIEAAHVEEHEEYAGWQLQALTWDEINVRRIRPMMTMLLLAVGFVLILVCVNVANLLMGRSLGRQREIAIRRALGAGTPRLVRQLLTESVVLSAFGGLLGIGVAVYGVRQLSRLVANFSRFVPVESIPLNGRVLLLAVAVSCFAGLAFGLAPALRLVRGDVEGELRSSPDVGAGRQRHRLQRIFVAAQIALALLLVHGGMLVTAEMVRLRNVDPGFEHQGVLTMRVSLPSERMSWEAIQTFFLTLEERLESITGLEATALASQFPPSASLSSQIEVRGSEPPADDRQGRLPRALTTSVTPSYLATLGIPLEKGRFVESTDAGDSPAVVVVNEPFAKTFLSGRAPIGRQLRFGSGETASPWHEVVGVIGGARNSGLDQPPQPEVFVPVAQGNGGNQLYVLMRSPDIASGMFSAELAKRVRQEVQSLDPSLAVYAVQSLEQVVERQATPLRVSVILLSALGVFALLLAGIGVYAALSVSVADRYREIGLRLALGASRGSVLGLLLLEILVPVVCGSGLGIGMAFALQRSAATMFGSAAGTGLVAGTWLALVATAVVAVLAPLRRAVGLDPLTTLRAD